MKPNLLFLATQLPELSSGSQVRSYYMIQHLKKSYAVTICCVTDHRVDGAAFKKNIHPDTHLYGIKTFSFLRKVQCLMQGTVPYVQRYRESIPEADLTTMLAKADICFCSELTGYLIAERQLHTKKRKLVIDAHNVEYIKFAGEVSSQGFVNHLLGLIITPVMKRIETRALETMSLIFACSNDDKKILSTLAPAVPVLVVPNGVDCEKFTPLKAPIAQKSLFFMGSLGYPPNDDALKYFLEKIYPRIKRSVPAVTLTIIGKGAHKWLTDYVRHDKTVFVKGFVPDVREYLQKAAVCICPLRFGSGTRLKVLEYMAMAKPVVATRVGAEGIELTDGIEVFLADTPKVFAEKTVTLLNDTELREKMGTAARERICEKYDWKRSISLVINEITKL